MVFARSLRPRTPAVLVAGVLGLTLAAPSEALAGPGHRRVRLNSEPEGRVLVGYRQVPIYRQEPVDWQQPVDRQVPLYRQERLARQGRVIPARVAQAPFQQVRNVPAPYQDYPRQRINATPYGSGPGSWEEAQQLQQRCSIGRLVGGVVGGGLGYAASRQDGRAWAVPLGALLGSQVGCNAGQGRDPLPW